MAIVRVINDNGTLKLETLSGAIASGLPLGTIIALPYGTITPQGFLPCNGATYDINQYPALYTYLQSNSLPDFRECALVGAGQNTTDTITSHDVYAGLQFKDDQLQDHNHYILQNNNPVTSCQVSSNNTVPVEGYDVGSDDVSDSSVTTLGVGLVSTARAGNTTHGKQKGVFYFIKAVEGWIDIDENAVYGRIVDLLEEDYLNKSALEDGAIVAYNETTGELDSITKPTQTNKYLKATVSGGTVSYDWSDPEPNGYNAVEDGELRAVSSNAVYDAIQLSNAITGSMFDCNSSTSVGNKVITIPELTEALSEGSIIKVRFINKATVASSQPTLKLSNGTDTFNSGYIKYTNPINGNISNLSSFKTGLLATGEFWDDNTILELQWCGTYWLIIGNPIVKQSTWVDSSSNLTCSYKIYANGYKEQNGILNNGSLTRDFSGDMSFFYMFNNIPADVSVVSAKLDGNAGGRAGSVNIYNITTTKISAGYYGISSSDKTQYLLWSARGY